MTHTPRKRFGQNFLVDNRIIAAIISVINPQATDHFLEIGPGSGALTASLVASGATIDAVEIDRDLAYVLQQEYSRARNFTLHTIDILKFSLPSIQNKKLLRVVGNLPYNISTPLLFKLFDDITIISDMFFMLQLEVGERLTASPGSKEYGRLSVMAQYHCDMELVLDVPSHAFNPPPKVESCIVKFIPKKDQSICVKDPILLQNIVTNAFSQRRKTLSNSLKQFITSDDLQQLEIDPKLRAENLSLSDYVNITNFLTR